MPTTVLRAPRIFRPCDGPVIGPILFDYIIMADTSHGYLQISSYYQNLGKNYVTDLVNFCKGLSLVAQK